jgi:hypothetical protein
MKQNRIVLGILFLFMGVIIAPGINTSAVTASQLITFPSIISMEYDEDYVNSTMFTPGVIYCIPVSIGYRVWVPMFFFYSSSFLGRLVKNWILFHALIAPFMTISLTVKDASNGIDVSPFPNNITVDIRNEYCTIQVFLIVDISHQTPPGSYTFSLYAESPQIHRIQGYETNRSITLTVQ